MQKIFRGTRKRRCEHYLEFIMPHDSDCQTLPTIYKYKHGEANRVECPIGAMANRCASVQLPRFKWYFCSFVPPTQLSSCPSTLPIAVGGRPDRPNAHKSSPRSYDGVVSLGPGDTILRRHDLRKLNEERADRIWVIAAVRRSARS